MTDSLRKNGDVLEIFRKPDGGWTQNEVTAVDNALIRWVHELGADHVLLVWDAEAEGAVGRYLQAHIHLNATINKELRPVLYPRAMILVEYEDKERSAHVANRTPTTRDDAD